MKIIAINGSPRKNGNTNIILNTVIEELNAEEIETELIHIGAHKFNPCRACYKCSELKDQQCHSKNDLFNECVQKIVNADGLLLGSPVYFADITPEMKAFIDVVGYINRSNGGLFKRKVGAAVSAVRRAGSIHALDSMYHFFQVNEFMMPGSSYWNLAIGRNPGDVLNDEEGINTMKTLGKNMAWLLKKLC